MTHKDYADFLLEQLSGLGEICLRPMMGEYVLYYRGKVAGGLYDDRFLVKSVPAAEAMMPEAVREAPYPGAKEMLLVDRIDEGHFLRELLQAMEPELPAPKPEKDRRRNHDRYHRF